MRNTQYLAAVAALVAPTLAQTFTSCNPLEKSCPSDKALGKSAAYDFSKGAPSDFTAAAGTQPVFKSDGAHFTIAEKGQAPTFSSNWYIMFGSYKVVMKPAPGQGIVSSLVLQSDDLDEIDWEWVGSQKGKVQTNYFGKGNTTVYDRGLTVDDPSNDFNTYEVDWTADYVKWIINGNTVRTLTPATADYNQYPQTPMQFKIGSWCAGDSSSPGTVEWAGGPVQWSQAPFDMVIKSVQITDYSTGSSYSYGDKSGNWQSIKSSGGKINSDGSVPSSISTASGAGTTLTNKPTASAVTNTFVSATTTNNVSQQTGTGAAVGTGSSAGTSGTGAGASTTGASSSSSTSSSTTAASTTPATGAAAIVKPVAGLIGAGLLAIFAL